MDFSEGIEFLNLVYAKENERYMWDLYCAQYPVMLTTGEQYITFAEFMHGTHSAPLIQNSSNVKTEDMIKELDRINAAAGGV